MSNRIRSIQCVVWVALASWVVMKLDERTRSGGPTHLPRIQIAALADSRHQPVPDSTAGAVRFEGFGIPDAMRDSIVQLARAQVGRRYRFGGTTPERGFDCSGFVHYVLGQLHVRLPRLAAQQAMVGAAIEREGLRPGDLVSFGPSDTISHIGIYIGDGRFVHASSVAGRVIESPLNRPPSRLITPLRGARRLLALAEQPERAF